MAVDLSNLSDLITQFGAMMPALVTFVIATVPMVLVLIFVKFFAGLFEGIISMIRGIF